MRSSRKTESSKKSFSATAWDQFLIFFFKIAIPLVPIILVFALAGHVMNMEVNGLYQGMAPGMGTIALELNEEDDQLNGTMIYGKRSRYYIAQGKMLDDNKMTIELRKQSANKINGVSNGQDLQNAEKSKASAKSLQSIPESSTPDDLSDAQIAAAKIQDLAPLIKIEATKDKNTLKGTIEKDGKVGQFTATRNSFSSFFGKRYITRTLKYFGIKSM